MFLNCLILTRYSKVWNKFFKPLNAFNCGIGGDGVQHVLWRAHDLRGFIIFEKCYYIIQYQ